MTDKTEDLKAKPADLKAREAADKAEEQAKHDPVGDAQKAAELESKASEALKAEAKGKTLKGEGPKSRVLPRRAFINGRLYEAGETVYEDETGTPRAVAKSTPAGDLSVDQLKQLLAEAQVREKTKAAKGE